MGLSLGEKLRSAREERGISISEVAEQTRISPLYLEAIDLDNYKSLPGGIFNKGFVRSYAKYVGVDEQEALQDYSRLIAESTPVDEAEFKTYRPEVLTDDRSATSIVPTVIFAAVILALMSAGILFLVNYIQNRQSEPPIAANTSNNAAVATNAAVNSSAAPQTGAVPAMGAVRIEFRTLGEEIWLSSVNDGAKGSTMISADKPATFEPKDRLTLTYSKSLARAAQLTINGKTIALPTAPLNSKKNVIELDINKENLAAVWQNGSFTREPTAAPTEANTAVNAAAQPTTPKATPKPAGTPKPAAANSNTASAAPPTMTGKPPARPSSTPHKPPANGER
jgi:cytoskeleton protein RodZ